MSSHIMYSDDDLSLSLPWLGAKKVIYHRVINRHSDRITENCLMSKISLTIQLRRGALLCDLF